MTEKQVTLTGIENKWIYIHPDGDYPKIIAPDGCFYCFVFPFDGQMLCDEINKMQDKIKELTDKNKELNTFKQKTLDLIDQKLEENPYLTLTEKWNPNCNNYESCRKNHEKNVAYGSKHMLLKELEKELKE